MKKLTVGIILLLLCAALALSLASCGGKSNDDLPDVDESKNGSDEGDDIKMPDFASIFNGTESAATVWGEQKSKIKEKIVSEAKKNGYDVSFGSDGSMTVKSKDGDEVVQNSDGTWTFKNKDGSASQLGGNWPDNEFTKLVPKPDFKLAGAAISGDEFSAGFVSVNADQVKAYAEKVKAGGFNVDPEENDQNVMGIVLYSYSARNSAGYKVEITFASGVSGIKISK